MHQPVYFLCDYVSKTYRVCGNDFTAGGYLRVGAQHPPAVPLLERCLGDGDRSARRRLRREHAPDPLDDRAVVPSHGPQSHSDAAQYILDREPTSREICGAVSESFYGPWLVVPVPLLRGEALLSPERLDHVGQQPAWPHRRTRVIRARPWILSIVSC